MNVSFLGVDQDPLALVVLIPFVVGLVLLAYLVKLRLKRPVALPRLLYSVAICTAVLGFGFVLQPLTQQAVGLPTPSLGARYFIEYQPLRAFRNIALAWFCNGLAPGACLGITLASTRLRFSLVGSACAASIFLVADDLYLPVVDWMQVHARYSLTTAILLRSQLDVLGISLVSDVTGGLVGGAICWWLIHKPAPERINSVAIRFVEIGGRGTIIVGALIALTVGIYAVFFHPIETHFSISAQQRKGMAIILERSDAEFSKYLFGIADNSLLSRVTRAGVINFDARGLVLTTINFMKLIDPNINNDLTVALHSSAISGRLVTMIGCKSAAEAYSASKGNSGGVDLDLRDATIALSGMLETTTFFQSAEPENWPAYIATEGLIARVVTPADGAVSLFAPGGELDVIVSDGEALVFQASPDPFISLVKSHKLPTKLDDVPPGSMMVSVPKRPAQVFKFPRIGLGPVRMCRSVTAADQSVDTGPVSKLASGQMDSYMVLRFEHAADNSYISSPLQFLEPLSKADSNKSLFVDNSNGGKNIQFLSSDLSGGQLTVGTRRLRLESGDSFAAAGSPIRFSDSPGSNFVAEGLTRYATLNGKMLLETRWGALDKSLKQTLVAAAIAAITFLLNRHWAKIERALVSAFNTTEKRDPF